MIDYRKLSVLLSKGDMYVDDLRELICELVTDENWLAIYGISELVSREVSILIDAKDDVWIDWGSIGQVTLSPPVGSILPYKLWVHTHPRNNAYWSQTDRMSLSLAKGILDKALVLGKNGVLSTSLINSDTILPDSNDVEKEWSEESVKSWLEISLNLKSN